MLYKNKNYKKTINLPVSMCFYCDHLFQTYGFKSYVLDLHIFMVCSLYLMVIYLTWSWKKLTELTNYF